VTAQMKALAGQARELAEKTAIRSQKGAA